MSPRGNVWGLRDGWLICQQPVVVFPGIPYSCVLATRIPRIPPKPRDAEQSTEGEASAQGVARCARDNICSIILFVQGRSHSLSDRSAFHRALIAFVFVAMVLLSGSLTRLAGADWPTQQIDDSVGQIEAPKHCDAPMVHLDSRSAEGLLEQGGELAEPKEDDETKHSLLPLDVVLPLDVAAFGSPTGLSESSAVRPPTRFRLGAFSSRGSPSA